MSTARREQSTVQSVTSAPRRAAEDLNARIRHYLITMAIRTGCFVLAFLTSGWVRWTCVALAVVLPYVAVVFANAHSPRTAGRVAPVVPRDPRRQIGS